MPQHLAYESRKARPPNNNPAHWPISLAILAAALSALLILAGPSSMLGIVYLLLLLIASTASIVGIIALFCSRQKRMTIAAILLALTAVLIPMLWFGDDPSPRMTKARTNATKQTLIALKSALDNFTQDNGRIPTTAEGLDALLNCSPTLNTTWHGPYIETQSIEDGWGHPFIYIISNKTDPAPYTLASPGPDGIPDTSDDIKNP